MRPYGAMTSINDLRVLQENVEDVCSKLRRQEQQACNARNGTKSLRILKSLGRIALPLLLIHNIVEVGSRFDAAACQLPQVIENATKRGIWVCKVPIRLDKQVQHLLWKLVFLHGQQKWCIQLPFGIPRSETVYPSHVGVAGLTERSGGLVQISASFDKILDDARKLLFLDAVTLTAILCEDVESSAPIFVLGIHVRLLLQQPPDGVWLCMITRIM
mmetsp:Transcript_37984/g.88738  ORF Transcript_37984/g.88738 Transcript_37984/m.88738 type:complete len:216 (+) Transcript_37984:1991-2638(+)